VKLYEYKMNESHSKSGLARSAQKLLIWSGGLLVGVFLATHVYAACFSSLAIWRMQVAQAKVRTTNGPVSTATTQERVDFTLWGKNRVQAYLASLALKVDAPMAVLSIPRLALTAPVFAGTDSLTLDRGLGQVEGTDRPGGDHNLGIAGHRDGFFRVLKDIKQGDSIEIERPDGKDVYEVESIVIVDPSDVSVLDPGTKSTLTLVTCYPFYFVGDAPSRYIVKASLRTRNQYSQVQNLQARTNNSNSR
jgi:sortase A